MRLLDFRKTIGTCHSQKRSVNRLARLLAGCLLAALCLASGLTACSSSGAKTARVDDATTPLHLLKPDYPIPYGVPSEASVREVMHRVAAMLSAQPMSRQDSSLQTGSFRLTSYEWGVTYAGMLAAAEATGEDFYADYVCERLGFLSRELWEACARQGIDVDSLPQYSDSNTEGKMAEGDEFTAKSRLDPQLRKVLFPGALDDCGAMCAAMVKATAYDVEGLPLLPRSELEPFIQNYAAYLMHGQMRLDDGTLARNRPFRHTVWLDDMFMSQPALARLWQHTGKRAYLDEACRQFRLFGQKMFVPETGLYRHGWVESMETHPCFYWARANGWALLTATELLDVLPADAPERPQVLARYRAQVSALRSLQDKSGFWHQLLDRPDTYLETSATAIYAYCMARGINQGWIEAKAFGPATLLAWNAVTTQVSAQGYVQGTCVGTGMAFDPAFYACRPVSEYAAHGYGPVLLAGAEVLQLLRKQHPTMNDSAVLFYDHPVDTDRPIFSEE